MASPNAIHMRPDFDPASEIVDTVEEVCWFTDHDEANYECGDTYNGMSITHAYIHPESDCAWIICKADDGGIWEFVFDGYTQCGMTGYMESYLPFR